jgi:hypothetical protein
MSDFPLDSFSVDGIVFLVSADEFHIDRLVVVGNGYYQSVIVALDVEHNPAIFEDTRASVLLLDFGGLRPRSLLGLINPRLERLLGVQVFFPKNPQEFDGYDVH